MERQAAACVSDGRPLTEGLQEEREGFSLRSYLHQQECTWKPLNGFHGSEGRGAARLWPHLPSCHPFDPDLMAGRACSVVPSFAMIPATES